MENEPESSIPFPEEEHGLEDNAGNPTQQEVPQFDSVEEEDDAENFARGQGGVEADEALDLVRALRQARPSWESTVEKGAEGFKSPPLGASPYGPAPGADNKTDYQAPFPESTTTESTTQAATAATNANEYGFELEVDSIDNDAFTVDIHVGYGEINDTPPSGMTGADDFIFTIPGADDGTEIYAVVTYDPDALTITSRSLAFAASVPDSVLGTLYIPIGFIDITYDVHGRISVVNPHNRQCGDINISFEYGDLNGQLALFFTQQLGDPIAV